MKLLNFQLSSLSHATSVIGFDTEWDFHNVGNLRKIEYDVNAATFIMKWSFDFSHSPWGRPKLFPNVNQCSLDFLAPSFVLILPKNTNTFADEDACISGISKVVPITQSQPKAWQYRVKEQWGENEAFNLLFDFQSGRSIEVGAYSVELRI